MKWTETTAVRIPAGDTAQLQRNLILSHCAGVGPALPERITRLVIALKLLSLQSMKLMDVSRHSLVGFVEAVAKSVLIVISSSRQVPTRASVLLFVNKFLIAWFPRV